MRVDEALQAITYFIDDARQFSYKNLRILHGTGTGALREAIRQYLNTVSEVKNYHDEHVQLGGAGITVVNLE
jgi:DNA mismatch repair protein MutS2